MGNTIISFGEKALRIHDSVLVVWLRLLTLNLREPEPLEEWLKAIRSEWLLASSGHFIGCIPLDLDAVLSDPGQKKVVLDGISSLRARLLDAEEFIDEGFLHLLGIEGRVWTKPLKAGILLDLCQAFTDLIEKRSVKLRRSSYAAVLVD